MTNLQLLVEDSQGSEICNSVDQLSQRLQSSFTPSDSLRNSKRIWKMFSVDIHIEQMQYGMFKISQQG